MLYTLATPGGWALSFLGLAAVALAAVIRPGVLTRAAAWSVTIGTGLLWTAGLTWSVLVRDGQEVWAAWLCAVLTATWVVVFAAFPLRGSFYHRPERR